MFRTKQPFMGKIIEVDTTSWNNTPAGHQLDNIIAKVAGWTELRPYYIDDKGGVRYKAIPPNAKYNDSIPLFSTFLPCTFKLNFELVETEYIDIQQNVSSWIVTVSKKGCICHAEENTLALVYCRAYLTWKGMVS